MVSLKKQRSVGEARERERGYMAVCRVRLGRSVPVAARRSVETPFVPEVARPGALVEVLHLGAWVSATVLPGNFPGAAYLRVVIDGAAISLARYLVRRPSCASRPRPPPADVKASLPTRSPAPGAAAVGVTTAPASAGTVVLALPAPVAAPRRPQIPGTIISSKKTPPEPTAEREGRESKKPKQRRSMAVSRPAPNAASDNSAAFRSASASLATVSSSKKTPLEPAAEKDVSESKKPKPRPRTYISRTALETSSKKSAPVDSESAPVADPGRRARATVASTKKRSLESAGAAGGERKKAKAGPGMGVSRAALEELFKEMKPLWPNARLRWRST